MTSLPENMRARVLETLSLIASKEAQWQYQRAAPQVELPAELFNQWEDCFFPDDDDFRIGFNSEELQALNHFNEVLNHICSETPQKLPTLEEFLATAFWHRLANAAGVTLSTLRQ